jgi:hypothetical protein
MPAKNVLRALRPAARCLRAATKSPAAGSAPCHMHRSLRPAPCPVAGTATHRPEGACMEILVRTTKNNEFILRVEARVLGIDLLRKDASYHGSPSVAIPSPCLGHTCRYKYVTWN